MSDDQRKRGTADRDRINVHEDYEVRQWTAKFGCSKEELDQAVKAVGFGAEAAFGSPEMRHQERGAC